MAGDTGARTGSGGSKSRTESRGSGAGKAESDKGAKKGAKKGARKRSRKNAKKRATRTKSARRKVERKKKSARRKAALEQAQKGDKPEPGPSRVAVATRARKPSGRARSGDSTDGPARSRVARQLRYPERIGHLRHVDGRAGAAQVELERGELRIGDALRIAGPGSDFYQRVDRIEIAGGPVEVARAGASVTVRLSRSAQENDEVFLLSN